MKNPFTNKEKYIGLLIYIIFIVLPIIGTLAQEIGLFDFSFGTRQFLLLKNSLKLAVAVTIINLVLGFLAALYISNSKHLKGWNRYFFVITIPIPFYIYALSWIYILQILSIFKPSIIQYSISGFWACVFVEVMAYLPITVLFLLLGIENLDTDKLRMAVIYRNDNFAVWKVILQSLCPYGLAVAGLICTFSMTEFSVPSMFQYNTYVLDIFSVYSRTGSAIKAYAQCIPLFIVLVVPVHWLVSNLRSFSSKKNIRTKYCLKITGWTEILSFCAFSILVIQVAFPIITLGTTMGGINNFFASFALITEEFKTSFWMSVFSAVICVLISYYPAKFLSEERFGLAGFIFYAIAIPGTIQAMGLLKLVNSFGWTGLEHSILMTSLGCALKSAPIIVLLLYASMLRVDKKALEIAEILSIRYIDYFRIKFDMLLPSILLGMALSFFFAFAEEGIPLILMAPGKETVTVKIYNYLHYGASEYVSAFSIIVVLFIMAIEIILLCFVKVFKGSRRK